MEQFQEREYQPKEVAEILDISTDLLRKWTVEFNVVVEKTEKGHRRYSKKNIEELVAINKKIKEQNWSWDQVRAWRNGEIDVFSNHEETSNLEKKMDKLMEMLEEERAARKKQEEFNMILVQKLADMESYIQKQLPNREDVEKRDRQLLLELRKEQEEKEQKTGMQKFLELFRPKKQ